MLAICFSLARALSAASRPQRCDAHRCRRRALDDAAARLLVVVREAVPVLLERLARRAIEPSAPRTRLHRAVLLEDGARRGRAASSGWRRATRRLRQLGASRQLARRRVLVERCGAGRSASRWTTSFARAAPWSRPQRLTRSSCMASNDGVGGLVAPDAHARAPLLVAALVVVVAAAVDELQRVVVVVLFFLLVLVVVVVVVVVVECAGGWWCGGCEGGAHV